jgi:GrpB-like predicted nucleotidyltransferase (UPF0157 family)
MRSEDYTHPTKCSLESRFKMIVIIPYQSDWPERFKAFAQILRRALGPLALRIDHIGST